MTRLSRIVLLLILFGVCAPSYAAINCDQTTLQAAVTAASRGDTITCNSGSWTWTNRLSITKGITIVGSGTIITRTNTTNDCQYASTPNAVPCIVEITPDATAIANNETISVSGFVFDGGSSITNLIEVNAMGVTNLFRNLRITGNTFQNANPSNVVEPGAIAVNGQIRGLISGNTFDRVLYVLRVGANDSPTEYTNGLFYPVSFGSPDNLYFETNTCRFSSTWTGADPCWSEIGQSGRVVYRFNTHDYANAVASSSEGEDIHGFQNWNGMPFSGQTGSMIVEYYRNTFINLPNTKRFAFRGTQGMFFDNSETGSATGASMMQMWQDVNGCDNLVVPTPVGYTSVINNTYEFNNTNDSGQQVWQVNTAGCSIADNVNYWSYTATFNGTVGVGRGTLASRPPTCATGVGYWATDQGSWNQGGSGVQGVFYKCTSTNMWTLYYTPYAYPYPDSGSTAGKTRLRGH